MPLSICRWVILLFALAASCWAPVVRAQSAAESRALAIQLFDEAEALLAKQQIAQACPKYAESVRLDPQLGSLIYLAECYEKNGQLASAWGGFRDAEELAVRRGDERQAHAHERAAALLPRLNRLVVNVPVASRVHGLEVLRDGLPVAATLWGGGAAIDPGKHRIVARAPGFETWQADLEIVGEGTISSITVPTLALDPVTPAPDGADTPGTTQRIAAIALGGVGIVGLGVGGFFGLSAQSSYSDSKASCNDDNVCTEHGKQLRDSAQNKALVSTISVGLGAAALVTAGVLWFTAPKAASRSEVTVRHEARWALGLNSRAWGVELNGAF